MAINQRKITELSKKWQRRLRLLDWKVTTKLVRKDKFDKVGEVFGYNAGTSLAFCDKFLEGKEAKIWILHPDDAQEIETPERLDIENTVVHELLHLHFAPFANGEKENSLLHEQAIEAITEALLLNE